MDRGWILTMKSMKRHESYAATEVGVFNMYFENIIPWITTRSFMTAWVGLGCKFLTTNFFYTSTERYWILDIGFECWMLKKRGCN